MDFLVAVHFLTTLPVPLKRDLPEDAWGRSMAYFPLVGLLLGVLLWAGSRVFGLLWPAGVAAALVLAEWVILTGALHLDGLIDCCDGLLAAKSPNERLQILRDVHAGSFGVVGAALLLIVKYAALSALLGSRPAGAVAVALLLAPTFSRWAMVYLTVRFPYGRPGASLGRMFASYVTRRSLIAASVIAAVLGLVVGGWMGVLMLALVWGFAALAARWVMNRIPGLTGDVYGAANELVELGVLLAALALR